MKRFLQSTTLIIAVSSLLFVSCTSGTTSETPATGSVSANIKMYMHTWDEIINHSRLDLFNDSNFTKDVVMHENPDWIGLDSARAYYANYLTGFSNIHFIIKDVFGQGNKIAKYRNFSGDNTGVFFGMPATGKHVSIDGVTLMRMENGKIAEERDFLYNLDLMT